MACEQDDEMLFLKKAMGLCSSVFGLLICLVYRNTLVVYQTTNLINDKIYDSKLITLGDFSVQGKISHLHWEKYLKGFRSENNSDEYVIQKFEKVLEAEI